MNDNKLLPDEIVFVDKDQVVTTSRMVAEAFGKRHDNVLNGIKGIEKQANSTGLKFKVSEYQDSTGRKLPEYVMNFDGFILLVMGYTGEKAMKIKLAYIEAFNRMRRELQERTPVLPDFTNPAEAARAWASEYEAKQIAIKERDEAIKTKAWISDKKTATAMATASKEKRRADKLADQLGEGKNYRTVMSIQSQLEHYLKISPAALQQAGKKLTKISKENGLEIHKVDHSKYGEVKAYNIRAVNELMIKLATNPDYLIKYRKTA